MRGVVTFTATRGLGLSLNPGDLSRAERRWGIGTARVHVVWSTRRVRVLADTEVESLRLWSFLRGDKPDGHPAPKRDAMVDRAMRAYLAAPAPFVLATPDKAATFDTAEELIAGWHAWGDPPATFIRLDEA